MPPSLTTNRRDLLCGLLAVAVAPAIIRTPGLLMPIRPPKPDLNGFLTVRASTAEALGVNDLTGTLHGNPIDDPERQMVGLIAVHQQPRAWHPDVTGFGSMTLRAATPRECKAWLAANRMKRGVGWPDRLDALPALPRRSFA